MKLAILSIPKDKTKVCVLRIEEQSLAHPTKRPTILTEIYTNTLSEVIKECETLNVETIHLDLR